jgi:hypothetical protein
MDAQLHQAISERLDRDYQFKRHGEWLQQGHCPSCGKKELYTHAEHPWVLRCNRINHCGFEDHVKELYIDLFESWSDRFPKQLENPNATADAYMKEARGFSLDRVPSWYTQESYFNHEQNIGSATVRFAPASATGNASSTTRTALVSVRPPSAATTAAPGGSRPR